MRREKELELKVELIDNVKVFVENVERRIEELEL